VLDPVVVKACDSLDQSIHEIVNRVFGRSHGGVFRFHSAEEIQELLKQEKFRVTRADVHKVSFDQDGMEGIPTGRHWSRESHALTTTGSSTASRPPRLQNAPSFAYRQRRILKVVQAKGHKSTVKNPATKGQHSRITRCLQIDSRLAIS